MLARVLQGPRCGFSRGESDRREAHFYDFRGALFGKTLLSGADFSEAVDFDIDVFDNQILGAKFSRCEALRLLASFKIELVD